MIKKVFSNVLIFLLCLSFCNVYAYEYPYYKLRYDERPITIQINGEDVQFASPPTSIDEVTYAQTDVLAEKLGIEAAQLESRDVDGVMMSPVRLSADKKGWSIYWVNWTKTVIIADTEALRNDFKSEISEYLDLIKKIVKVPENCEYTLASDYNIDIDGGDNGFKLYTKEGITGSVKFDKAKICGNISVKCDGLNKLVMMIFSNMFDMPTIPVDVSFYADDSGMYYKSEYINMLIFSRYSGIPDEFRKNNAANWVKIGYEELGINGLDDLNSFRNTDPDYLMNNLVNSIIFGNIDPQKVPYISNWTYESWKSVVDKVKEYKPNNFIESSENNTVIKFTAKDLQWILEKCKEDLKANSDPEDAEAKKNVDLFESFISGISGEYKAEYIFENNMFKEATQKTDFKLPVPFFFNQKLLDTSILADGSFKSANIDQTVISDTAPQQYITTTQIKDAYKYKLEKAQTQNNSL